MQYFVQEQLHTIETASEILKCNERVLREKVKAGIIKGHKKFGKWYVLYSDLIAFVMSEGTEDGTEEDAD